MKSFLLLIFLSFYFYSNAQQNTQLAYDTSRVDAKLIVGLWESADSNKYKIEFLDEGWAVKLKADVGVAGGYFFSKDSLSKITLSGYAPNWPPYYCSLQFLSTDTLEVVSWCFMCEAIRSKYVKVKEK